MSSEDSAAGKRSLEDKISSNVRSVLMTTIIAGTVLMTASMFAPSPAMIKEVLPFATGLIGFAGGLVMAIFGK